MKKHLGSLIFTLVFGLTATATEPIIAERKAVNADKSKITWKAYKVGGGHVGTVDLKEGSLVFEKEKLTGGKFVVDMTTITPTDIEGEMKGKLQGHLRSDDFFGVSTHQTAKLVMTKAAPFNENSYTVTGDLTIKGITKPVTFVVSIYGNKATATLKIDRAEYDVRYGSGSFFENLGDKTIYDEFDLVVDMVF